jgi:PKHD-type hydroxylase
MLVQIPQLLSAEQVAQMRAQLAATNWVEGKVTAGAQSAEAKNNLQVPEDGACARALGDIILGALGQNQRFMSASLALRVFPPLFNRYDRGMDFGAHIDNAIRLVKPSLGTSAPIRVRTDLSATLFLTDPADYDGGELVVEDTFGSHKIKLAAGDLVLYSATSRHHKMQHYHAFDTGLAGRTGILLEAVELGQHPAQIAVTGFAGGFLRRWNGRRGRRRGH